MTMQFGTSSGSGGGDLPSNQAVVTDGGFLQVRNSQGADPHPALLFVADNVLAGANLAPTASIIDDGDVFTASTGQTVNVSVAAGVPQLTVVPNPFWQPFTVTAAPLTGSFAGGIGYAPANGGSVTNQPLDGYTLDACLSVDFGSGATLLLKVSGPQPLRDNLFGAAVGVDAQSYEITDYDAIVVEQTGGAFTTTVEMPIAAMWADGASIPIVIIPAP